MFFKSLDVTCLTNYDGEPLGTFQRNQEIML